jgi:hypothetical protein
MVDTVIRLGDVDFKSFEIPESLPFGGGQQTVTHKLPGGKCIIDAMGRDDAPIEWSGLFMGADATDRAKMIDAYRVEGKALTLSWWNFNFTVVVREFRASWQRWYQIPYRISCEVVSDNVDQTAVDIETNIDDAVAMDAEEAAAIADDINNTNLTNLVSAVISAIDAVESIVAAATSDLTNILNACATVSSVVTTMIGSDETIIDSYTDFGGVSSGSTYGEANTSLSALQTAIDELTCLVALQARINRIVTNVSADDVAGQTKRVAGGTLYRLAADAYGDAAGWTTIAQANGLTDPVLSGTATLNVPTTQDDTGGVLTP